MATYYVLYNIYSWADEDRVAETSTTIGGVEIRTQFNSTSYYNGDASGPLGFNHVRFVGLVPASLRDGYEFGVSWDDVGTTYLSYQTTVEIPDDIFIDPSLFATTSDGLTPDWVQNGREVSISWETLQADGYVGLNLSTAFQFVAEYAAEQIAPGYFSDLIASANRVQSLAGALNGFMADAGSLLEAGIGDFETISAKQFAARTDMLLRDTQAAYLAELENQLGINPAASTLLRTVNLIGDFSTGSADIEIGFRQEAPVAGGLAVLGVDVRAYVGSQARDVIAPLFDDQAASGTVSKVFELNGGDDVFAGSGSSEIVYGGADDDDIFLGRNADLSLGGSGRDQIFGGGGDDTLFGNLGADYLVGGPGNDRVAGGFGRDELFGRTGRDIMRGGNGADTLSGNAGKDRLIGGPGDDMLTGGKGADRFIITPGSGTDTITDFDPVLDGDKIDLRAIPSISGYADLITDYARQNGADVVISSDDGAALILTGIRLSQLDADDFLF